MTEVEKKRFEDETRKQIEQFSALADALCAAIKFWELRDGATEMLEDLKWIIKKWPPSLNERRRWLVERACACRNDPLPPAKPIEWMILDDGRRVRIPPPAPPMLPEEER